MKIVNSEQLQKKIDWFPHEDQNKVLEVFNRVREIVVCAGRRAGKTMLASFLLLRELLADNKTVAIICPTYDLTERVFTYLAKWLKLFSKDIKIQTRPYPKITLNWRNGRSVCYGLSAESPNQILGRSYDLVVVDEASRIPENIYQQYIFPALTSTKGRAIFISTPTGKNWFYQKFLEAKNSEEGFAISFNSKSNPYFPSKEWERAKAKLPSDVFAQEFEASFLDNSASVFRGVRDCIKDDCLRGQQLNHKYIGGLDLAKSKDFSVLTIIDKSVVPYKLVALHRWNRLPYTSLKAKVFSIAKKYNNAEVVVEINNVGVAVADELKVMGVKVKDFTTYGSISPDFNKKGSKQIMIEKLSALLEGGFIEIPNNEVLIDELESYGYKITKKGNITYSCPEGHNFHDDCVMSLALAVSPLKQEMRRVKSIETIRKNRERSREMKIIKRQQRDQYQ